MSVNVLFVCMEQKLLIKYQASPFQQSLQGLDVIQESPWQQNSALNQTSVLSEGMSVWE